MNAQELAELRENEDAKEDIPMRRVSGLVTEDLADRMELFAKQVLGGGRSAKSEAITMAFDNFLDGWEPENED